MSEHTSSELRPHSCIIELNHRALLHRMQHWQREDMSFPQVISSALHHAAVIGVANEFVEQLKAATGYTGNKTIIHSWTRFPWFREKEPEIVAHAHRILESMISAHGAKVWADFEKASAGWKLTDAEVGEIMDLPASKPERE